MDYRTSLQHLLHKLLPAFAPPERPVPGIDFADTRPDARRPTSPTSLRRVEATPNALDAWGESAIDLVLGSEVMEFPDDTSADLMHEYFDGSQKRAA